MAAPAPEAPATPTSTPVLTDLARLVRSPFTPRRVYEEQSEHPTYWIPWLIVSVVFAVLQLLQRPFQGRVREIILEHLQRPVPAPASLGAAAGIGLVSSAFMVLLFSAIAAGIFYVLVVSFGGETTFKKMMTVAIFAWPIVLLQQLLVWLALSIRGVDAISSIWDVQVSFGVDLLLPSGASLSPFLRLFLAGIGPLALWQAFITATGIMVLGKTKPGAAWLIAVVQILVILSLLAALGAFGIRAAGG